MKRIRTAWHLFWARWHLRRFSFEAQHYAPGESDLAWHHWKRAAHHHSKLS